MQHREYLAYCLRDAANFVVLKNETFHHPKSGASSRIYMWSCAMTGMHSLEAYHHADNSSEETLADDGRLKSFMEATDFHNMKPHDELAIGSTKWVLANPGKSYIAYSYACSGAMGIKLMHAGTYDLRWFDTANGREIEQSGVAVPAGDVTWEKPVTIGTEIALYIKRRD